MRTKKRLALVTGLIALGAGLITPAAVATPEHRAPAASCLGGAWRYDKAPGEIDAPPGAAYYRTTNRCADIQVKPSNGTVLKLCYLKNHDENQVVCKDEVNVPGGSWKILGTDFKDGVEFWLRFSNAGARKTGLVAA
ncbi:hypothetical protein C9F11_40690 [Streptomyces sp. YIM 121038]|uniref:hypothetical protein n=1 Tax=Streptomyces sp. YIM 121038 TaxID=2136401 RepID=UPI0011109922|nr:hypothetical protein [Streptomyces sp. YIM 121038]QCX81718.1 hypothetical protein C9F11_40690 [Streptomyces sp. YIM 121038]